MPNMLSKSRVLSGKQCPKRLWLEANRAELLVVPAGLERRFAQGLRLNDLVHHKLLPEGQLVPVDVPLAEAAQFTQQALLHHPQRPLFEATFSQHRVFVRADIFQQVGGAWRLTEVKSSTRVKQYHLTDCAVQAWVIQASGYPLEEIRLAHVDTKFRYRGNGDYHGLLKEADVTEDVKALQPLVAGWVAQGFEALAGPEPDIDIGPHCTSPFPCPFADYCTPAPPEYPVTLLPNRGKIVDELLAEGITDVRDIPEGRLTKPMHLRVYRATVTGQPYIAPELASTLNALPYPRYYLDFETIQFVIPLWADTHPYEQLPFQWSCHIETAGDALRHEAFLDITGEAPMRACAEKLVESLGRSGPILTYSPFERRVMGQLGRRFPDLKPRLDALIDRLVDLLPTVRNHYYHPAMKGSFSIKAVLPVVAPHLSYEGLGEVKDGVAAQVAFEEAIDPATEASRQQQIQQELLAYCALDTLAMVELVRSLSAATPTETVPG